MALAAAVRGGEQPLRAQAAQANGTLGRGRLIRKVSLLKALIAVMAIVAVSVGLLELNPLAAQAGPSASRSLSVDSVAAGGELTVTITADGYGIFGDVVETLPAGFDYVSSDLPDDQVTLDGQTVRFGLIGGTPPITFTYTVTASNMEGEVTLSRVPSPVSMQETSTLCLRYRLAAIPTLRLGRPLTQRRHCHHHSPGRR